MKIKLTAILLLFSLFASSRLFAQPADYNIGSPALTELWVDPANGNDNNDGLSGSRPLRTVIEAWGRIPSGTVLSQGYRINLMPGTYPENSLPLYWENRLGSWEAPIILQSSDPSRRALFTHDINLANSKYVYLIGFDIRFNGDVFHCEGCQNILIRDMVMNGLGGAHETIKANQSMYMYVEDSDISGAYENAVDYVAVQYGHMLRNQFHNGGDWCVYVKGGSAYIHLEGNRIYDCATGGFTSGQGTGFEYMVAPWLHYEASHITFVNNLVYRTTGAGIGVNGGYNILYAFNTLYRVGTQSHAIEVFFGRRSCDGNAAGCLTNHNLGGWGPPANTSEGAWIPNRNVYILNNVIYNPMPLRSAWQQISVQGPQTNASNTNLPSPAVTDTNLRIAGNVVWNGPGVLDLGVGGDQGCQDSNPTCNAAQLNSDNRINSVEPQMRDVDNGDFRPVAGSNLLSQTAVSIPAFPGDDRPQPPLAPEGTLSVTVTHDKGGAARGSGTIPGAYASDQSDIGNSGPPDGGETNSAPVISRARCTPLTVKIGKSISCTASVTDDGSVTVVRAHIGSRYQKKMTLKKGLFRMSWKVPAVKQKSLTVKIRAFDDQGKSRQVTAGKIKVKTR